MKPDDYTAAGGGFGGLLYAGRVRVLGIDYGDKRIGLALSDATGLLARPWKTIERRGAIADVVVALAREIVALRAEGDGLGAVVIGWPRRLSGEPTNQTASVTALAERLRAAFDLPVTLQDERLSSHEADARLAEREKDWRKRKQLLDAAAAAIILQDFLDAHRMTTEKEGDA
jgi:putative Holliday junction resolvase